MFPNAYYKTYEIKCYDKKTKTVKTVLMPAPNYKKACALVAKIAKKAHAKIVICK